MKRSFLLIQLCFYTCISFQAWAQSTSVDSAIRRDAYNQAVNNYFHSMAENSQLNQGIEVVEYSIPSQMHQYFLTDQFSPGEVVANGIRYPDAYLLYDLVHDKLVV